MRSLQLRILAVFRPSTGNPRCGCTLETVCCSFSSSSLFYKLALPAEIFRPRLSHAIWNRESNTSWAKPWHGNLELLLKVANITAKRAYENIITRYVLSMYFLDHSSLSVFLSIVIGFSRNNRGEGHDCKFDVSRIYRLFALGPFKISLFVETRGSSSGNQLHRETFSFRGPSYLRSKTRMKEPVAHGIA